MPAFCFCFHYPIKLPALAAGLLAIALTSGCTTSSVTEPPAAPTADTTVPPIPSDWKPVARYGRYTLVELTPRAAQHNLLLQVIDVTLPATVPATVGDALRYVLLRSGYTLCERDAETSVLYGLPLPAAHWRLGPLLLRDALLTLAGPAWALHVDEAARQVCFAPRSEPLA